MLRPRRTNGKTVSRIITISIAVFAAAFTFSCNQKNTNEQATSTAKPKEVTLPVTGKVDAAAQERIAYNKRIYKEALANSDAYTQLSAVYGLMADDTVNRKAYLDTLASLYSRLSMAEPAAKLSERILAADPSNKKALELKSMLSRKPEDALNAARRLYEQTKDVKYLFQIAQMQLEAGKVKDYDKTIETLEKNPKLDKETIPMQTGQGGTQEVPARAVLTYMKAMPSIQEKDYVTAENMLRNALRIYPDFVMAKYYLDNIEAMQKQKK